MTITPIIALVLCALFEIYFLVAAETTEEKVVFSLGITLVAMIWLIAGWWA